MSQRRLPFLQSGNREAQFRAKVCSPLLLVWSPQDHRQAPHPFNDGEDDMVDRVGPREPGQDRYEGMPVDDDDLADMRSNEDRSDVDDGDECIDTQSDVGAQECEGEDEDLGMGRASMSPAQSSTSTSDSSSSSTSSSQQASGSGQRLAEGAPLAEVADEIAPVAQIRAPPAARVHNAESFAWGSFFFTRRENPPAWQILCRYHPPRGRAAACTKSCQFATEAESDQVIRRMKSWALRAHLHDSKTSHQGARGLPAELPAHRELSDMELDELRAAMPAL